MQEKQSVSESNTSYNISVESYSQIQDEINKNCKFIETFIVSRSEKYSNSEIFKTLVALHDLFKLEISHGLQLRQALISEKNEFSKTKTELQSFFNFCNTTIHSDIHSISQAKKKIRNIYQEYQDKYAQYTLEIAEYTSKLDNTIESNKQLQIQLDSCMKQIQALQQDRLKMVSTNELTRLISENQSLKITIQNQEKQINELNFRVNQTFSKDEQLKIMQDKIESLQKELSDKESSNKSLKEENDNFSSKIAAVNDHLSTIQNRCNSTIEKMEIELENSKREIRKLRNELSDREEIYTKKLTSLERDKSLLVDALNRVMKGRDMTTGYLQSQNVINQIYNVLDLPKSTKSSELPSIIASKMSGSSFSKSSLDSTYNISGLEDQVSSSDEYYEDSDILYDNEPGIRSLILVIITCKRLLQLSSLTKSDLQKDINDLKKDIKSTREQLLCF